MIGNWEKLSNPIKSEIRELYKAGKLYDAAALFVKHAKIGGCCITWDEIYDWLRYLIEDYEGND